MSDIYLYVYDLSKGMAKAFSAMFLGRHFDGIWHTGIVAYGNEWYFGNDGINYCPPKGTILGEPNEIVHLGKTDLTESDFYEIINQLRESSYKIGSYNLLEHNCNNFSNDLSLLVAGKPIPSHIIELPKEILNTPIGPMLRPLLEQAADPLHQYGSGGIPNLPMFGSNAASLPKTSNSSQNGMTSSKIETPVHRIPITVALFKSDYERELDSLIKYCELNKTVNENEKKILVEIKDYLNQVDIKWSIGSNHVKLLFDLYFNLIKNEDQHVNILKVFQLIALNLDVAKVITHESLFENVFIPKLKDLTSSELKILSIQMLSNLCSNETISRFLLEKHQNLLFKELSDYALIEAQSDTDILIHESSISFFYNLISAYHLENFLNDSNALTLGVALLERLPKLKSKPKTIYQMLSLLRSCLLNSESMRELATSMEFDLTKYTPKATDTEKPAFAADSSVSQNDSYESIIKNIDKLIHVHNTQN